MQTPDNDGVNVSDPVITPGVNSAMGRPSVYTDELAQEICTALSLGNSLRTICDLPDMPSETTVYRWLTQMVYFRDMYTQARAIQADVKFDQVGDIAMTATPENANALRVQIDALKWQTVKLAPRKYGDVSQVKHSGAIGTFDASKYSDDQLSDLERVLGPIAASGSDAADGSGGEGSTGG